MKYLSLLVAACLLLTALLTGCGSSTETPTQTTMETTTESMQGYTISELQDAIVEMLKREDPDYITPYMLPGAEQALEYARQINASGVVDDEGLGGTASAEVMFSLFADEGIYFGDSVEYSKEKMEIYTVGEMIAQGLQENDARYEAFQQTIQEMQQCFIAVGYDYEFTDWGGLVVNDMEQQPFALGATILKTDVGWFIFSFLFDYNES